MKKNNNKIMDNFFLMGENEREKVEKWIGSKKIQRELEKGDTTTDQYLFLKIVEKALDRVDYDYQIPMIEPSKTEDGKIFYKKGSVVPLGLENHMSAYAWEKAAVNYYYDGKWSSGMATIYELYLWYAYRIAMKYWTIEYVCVDSRGDGNYGNDAGFEKSGERKVGGFADGTGNSFKLVKYGAEIVAVGGSNFTNGAECPVARISYDVVDDEVIPAEAVGVIVLRSLE